MSLLRGFQTALFIVVPQFFCVAVVHAEYFGTPTGRTADFSTQPALSIEAAISNGEFIESDYQQFGLRLNYQYAPQVLLFGDLGRSEVSSQSETSFGLGAYYSLQKSILGSDDSAVKVSFHQANFGRSVISTGPSVTIEQVCRPDDPITFLGILQNDLSPSPIVCLPEASTTAGSSRSSGSGSIRNIAMELLISGGMSEVVLGNNTNWYVNGGIQLLGGDIDSDTVVGFGAGIVIPINKSEVYAGFDYADDTSIGVGYRYFVQ